MHSISKLKVVCILGLEKTFTELKSDQLKIAFAFSQMLSKSKRYVNHSTIEKTLYCFAIKTQISCSECKF